MGLDDYQRVMNEWDSIIPKVQHFQNVEISETDTRCKIIDPIVFNIMGWEQDNVTMEPRVSSGYIDYYCSGNKNKFVIEAKRTAVSFKMPKGTGRHKSKTFEKGNNELFLAIQQARNYSREKECPFCIVSNGLNFAISKTYPSENEPDTVVVAGKDGLRKFLPILFEIMSPHKDGYKYFTEYLLSKGDFRTPRQFSKTISSDFFNKHSMISENNLSSVLKGYVNAYFGDVDTNKDLLNEVYCDTDDLEGYSQEIRTYLRERVPFFNFPVKEVTVKGQTASNIGTNYKMKFQNLEDGHVFMLLGNLGAGKTTFINRFYSHILDEATRKKLVWIKIDFIKLDPGNPDFVNFIFNNIRRSLREEYSQYKLNSVDVLTEMYKDELGELEDGIWSLLPEEKRKEKQSEFFERKMADQNEHLKNQCIYIRKQFSNEICLVFDNVDHHSTEIQTKICSMSIAYAKDFKALILLSLRDETHWNMKNDLPNNAYNNITTYQIIPPDVSLMIQKRLNLVKSLVGEEKTYFDVMKSGTTKVVSVRKKEIFEAIESTIRSTITKDLFENISSGDMRYALECFGAMVTSGHTDLEKLFKQVVNTGNPKLLYHWEVLNSIALGRYKYYSSEKSIIVNLFSTFKDGFYSHFVLIRILEMLKSNKEFMFNSDVGKGYVPIKKIFDEIQPYCNNEEMLRQMLIPLLQSYLIDSDIGSRKPGDKNYYDKIRLVKLTPAGHYYISELMGTFQYLEIVLYDTPIHNEAIHKMIGSQVIDLRKKTKDWNLRFQMVELFISYLEEEEARDCSYFSTIGVTKWGKVIPTLREIYDKDKAEIVKRTGLPSKKK